MKNIFTRKKPVPQPEPAVVDLSSSFLDVPTIETPTVKPVQPEDMCTACGKPGAKYPLPFSVSCFGYIRLEHIILCKECDDKRITAQLNHSFKQRKEWPDTQVRLVAIDAKMKAREA